MPRTRLWVEVALVLTLTFGMSAATSVLSLLEAFLTTGIENRTVAINTPRADVGWIDGLRQLLGVVRLLAWAALVVYLLRISGVSFARIGLRLDRPLTRIAQGFGFAALIGLPGLALYFAGRALGFTSEVVPSTLDDTWWRAPVLIAWAMANSVAEETVVVAYLLIRLRQAGLGIPAAIAISATLRGLYHLYQGVGPGLGNVAMGVVFAWWFLRGVRSEQSGQAEQGPEQSGQPDERGAGRLWPLIVAHAVIDIVVFLGASLVSVG